MKKLLASLCAFLLLISQAAAGGFILDPFTSFPSGGAPPAATITFLQCADITTNLTTYTFSAQNTGTASGDRRTGIAIGGIDGNSVFDVSTVTVGGDSASEVADTAGVFTLSTALYLIANPSGTSEDVVVTFTEQVNGAVICLWQINNLVSDTAVDLATASETNGAALDLNVDTSADGVAFGMCNYNSGSPVFDAWVGFTERTDAVGGDQNYSAADFDEDGSASVPFTVSCDTTGTNDFSGVSASFR